MHYRPIKSLFIPERLPANIHHASPLEVARAVRRPALLQPNPALDFRTSSRSGHPARRLLQSLAMMHNVRSTMTKND